MKHEGNINHPWWHRFFVEARGSVGRGYYLCGKHHLVVELPIYYCKVCRCEFHSGTTPIDDLYERLKPKEVS